jgi:multidrug resistance efflux pump
MRPRYIAILILLFAAALVIFSSCKTVEKTTTKSETNKDSLAVVEATKRLADMQKERDHYESKLKEMEYLQATFKECPPRIDVDSLRSVLKETGCDPATVTALINELDQTKAEYERLADGTVRIKGNLASITAAKSKQEDSLREITKENARLLEELQKSQTNVKTEIKTVEKEVTRKPVATWYLLFFVIGAVVGGWVWDRWGAKIKTIKIFNK